MGKRKTYDHDAIGKVYRAGQLSDREIAYQYGCSHTYIQQLAKKYEWKKDLSQRVKAEAVSKLVAKIASGNTDDEIVSNAADVVVGIVESHRKDIRALRELEANLIEELNGNPTKLYMAQYQGNIIEKVVALTAAERAQAANNLANVQHKRIALERQAFNIDNSGGSGGDVTIKITGGDAECL